MVASENTFFSTVSLQVESKKLANIDNSAEFYVFF